MAEFDEQFDGGEFEVPPALEPVPDDELVVNPAPGTPFGMYGLKLSKVPISGYRTVPPFGAFGST